MILRDRTQEVRYGRMASGLVAVTCFLRRIPLFFSATPKTPLRVLCVIAFDALHMLRESRPLPRQRLHLLAAMLDLGAYANLDLDDKQFDSNEYQATRQRLENTGISSLVDEYLRRLQELERRRPLPGGSQRRFDEVREYREAVARLSLGMVAAIAFGDNCLADGIQATHSDAGLETLFRIVMLCQIIDDAMDYSQDLFAGLPSFLTASASLSQAIELTAQAAQSYSSRSSLPQPADAFSFRAALLVVSVVTKLTIRLSNRQNQRHLAHRLLNDQQRHKRVPV